MIDYEYVQSLQGPKSVSTASKRAYASTTEYLPGLVNIVNDMGRLSQMAIKQKVIEDSGVTVGIYLTFGCNRTKLVQQA